MGFLDAFKKQKTGLKHASMLNGYTPIFSQFGQDIYASDVVQQAINCIVREMKKLDPQHVIEKGSDITPVDDEIQKVLNDPNSLMTTSDMIEKITWQLFFNYNAFVFPSWDRNGRLTGLYPLQPVQVDFLQDASETYFVKLTFSNNYNCTIKYSDIIHIRYNYSVNEFMGGNSSGQPDNKALLKTLDLNNTLLQGVGKALKSSFAINGIIKYSTLLDEDKMEKSMKELVARVERGEAGLLGLDLKAEYIPLDRKIAMVDPTTLKFVDEKILRHFGVSLPILTGDYTKDQYDAFYQKTLEPLIKSLNQAFTKTLFSKREAGGFGHKINFYSEDLISMNISQKLEMVRLLGDSGGLYENEKRAIFGLKPIAELEGVRLQSLNYASTDLASQYQMARAKTLGKAEEFTNTKEEEEET